MTAVSSYAPNAFSTESGEEPKIYENVVDTHSTSRDMVVDSIPAAKTSSNSVTKTSGGLASAGSSLAGGDKSETKAFEYDSSSDEETSPATLAKKQQLAQQQRDKRSMISSRVKPTTLELTPAAPNLNTLNLMESLTSLLEEMCQRNDKLFVTNTRTITKFHSADNPTISIKDYAIRIRTYSTCSDSCFILAVMYMDRIQSRSFIVDSLNVHRLLVTCVMLAAKFMDDRSQVNSIYAQIGGISNSELNQLEIELLNLLDFVLMVDLSQYDLYTRALERRAILLQKAPRTNQTSDTNKATAAPNANDLALKVVQ